MEKRDLHNRRRGESEKKQAQNERFGKFLRQNTWVLLLALLILVALVLLICVIAGGSVEPQTPAAAPSEQAYTAGFIRADTDLVPYYDAQLNELGTVGRGTPVTWSRRDRLNGNGGSYYMTYLDELRCGYVSSDCLTESEQDVVREKEIFVRTPQNLRPDPKSEKLGKLLEKGTKLEVLDYDYIADGAVHLYHVRCGSDEGYISGSYTSLTAEGAQEVYDRFGIYSTHAARGDVYGGGDAESLDYYPRKKADFPDNVMPDPCYGLYLTCDPEVIGRIDEYIDYAKSTKINTFVVNIIDGTSVGYPSEVYREYSPTAYEYANNTTEKYRDAIRKIKDAGFYAVGRLTVFNDSFFVTDHPEYAICDRSGDPLWVAGSYWPSAFCRYAWEYKVALAKDAIAQMGFDEIQFDYVRFPDGTYTYEESGNIDYHNENGETKAQAIQRFLMYACDVLHDCGVYVGADVFGETCGTYVTAYGQYWAAISNVVDVISAMPYPDHFSQDGAYRPWEHPYETVLDWSQSAAKRQTETPSPAVARTWVQAYDAIRYPYNAYGAKEVGDEIRALREGGLEGGFMAWNATCSLEKLEELRPVYEALP